MYISRRWKSKCVCRVINEKIILERIRIPKFGNGLCRIDNSRYTLLAVYRILGLLLQQRVRTHASLDIQSSNLRSVPYKLERKESISTENALFDVDNDVNQPYNNVCDRSKTRGHIEHSRLYDDRGNLGMEIS